ncbi:MAG: 4-(cytidine 5'-diphospho)-2-C-methyl-D-erythritol kinase [Gammaproteobacteria bacterium]|jgi:4-diphosphocytidyl-2-C-methyl-D-erythritol kinase
MSAAPWPAPAKLNLMLHITGRRGDGYHLLQTVFQFLDYGDMLRFEIMRDGRILLENPVEGVADADNLLIRAAALLQRHSGCGLGVRIAIDKRLPMGGGLGGGSSDAATVLVALNHLWNTGLDEDELAALGLELGADVPVFVRGHACWAEGVGEKITPVTLPESCFLVVVPPVQISTAALFRDDDLTRDCPPIKIAAFVAGGGRNVFTPVVRKRYPQVAEMMDFLAGFGDVRLTGTGACLFLAFDACDQALGVQRQLPDNWRSFTAQGVNESPLRKRLAEAVSTADLVSAS